MHCLDTSVLVSALSRESRSDDVPRWRAKQDFAELSISDWVVTEFSSALSIKVRTGVIDAASRGAILALFTQMSVNTFRMLSVETSAVRTAARFCDQAALDLRAGDAMIMAPRFAPLTNGRAKPLHWWGLRPCCYDVVQASFHSL